METATKGQDMDFVQRPLTSIVKIVKGTYISIDPRSGAETVIALPVQRSA